MRRSRHSRPVEKSNLFNETKGSLKQALLVVQLSETEIPRGCLGTGKYWRRVSREE